MFAFVHVPRCTPLSGNPQRVYLSPVQPKNVKTLEVTPISEDLVGIAPADIETLCDDVVKPFFERLLRPAEEIKEEKAEPLHKNKYV